MASAVVSLQVGAAPTLVPAGDVEVLETFAQIPDGNEPVTVRLRAKPGSKQAELLQRQSEGSKLLVSGKLHLEDSEPVITPQVICEATDDQYFNEVTLVGNLARQGREAGKSCSRSMAISRPVRNGDGWDEHTDWFMLRGFGAKDENTLRGRLQDAPKGSLVHVSGTLSQRKSKNDEAYVEIKLRSLRVHKRGGGGSAPNPAEGKEGVAGYDQSDFEQDDMPAGW